MAEYYNMILDEDELHWFFDHIIQKPLEYETYMIMLACRGKKLTDEEREYTKVGARGEMMREELIRCKGGLKQEWNFDIVFLQCVVDGLLKLCGKENFLLHEHPNAHEEVHTTWSEIAEGNDDVLLRVDEVPSIACFSAQRLNGFDNDVSHFLYVLSISHSRRNLHHQVAVVSSELMLSTLP